jgi:hypothetical protein
MAHSAGSDVLSFFKWLDAHVPRDLDVHVVLDNLSGACLARAACASPMVVHNAVSSTNVGLAYEKFRILR